MSEEVNIPDLPDYVSIKDAAKMLGLAYTTVHEYVSEGRLRAVRAADVILLPVEEVRNFKPNISGRPRTSIPQWRIAREDNTLSQTTISVQLREGKRDTFLQRLEEIRTKKEHLFPGTVARYIAGSSKRPNSIKITFIWRSSVMPDEATRRESLKAFQDALADLVDWTTARYNDGIVFMHAQ
jgi:excisionase family DNA binding protein